MNITMGCAEILQREHQQLINGKHKLGMNSQWEDLRRIFYEIRSSFEKY